MTAVVYTSVKESAWQGGINLLTDTIKALLVDATYIPNLDTDAFLSIIPGGAIVATSPALSGKTIVAGVFNAADQAIPAVSGPTIVAVVLFKDTGVAATSRLIFYDSNASGLPAIPAGNSITLRWSLNANKVMRL